MPNGNLTVNRCKIIYNPDIPLAMYRELASHIEQIEDVTAELFWQESREFSYLGSQIGGMWLNCDLNRDLAISSPSQVLIKSILNHYGNWVAENKK